MKNAVHAVIFGALISFSCATFAQIGPSYTPGVDPKKKSPYSELEAIHLSHGKNQRTDVKRMFLDIGHRLHTDKSDLPVMQRILRLRKIQRTDVASQQALGLVFGDILAKELDLDWVIYQDDEATCKKKGLRYESCKSRALRYKDSNIVIFPVTMISRRYKAGIDVDVVSLHNKIVKNTQFLIDRERGF